MDHERVLRQFEKHIQAINKSTYTKEQVLNTLHGLMEAEQVRTRNKVYQARKQLFDV